MTVSQTLQRRGPAVCAGGADGEGEGAASGPRPASADAAEGGCAAGGGPYGLFDGSSACVLPRPAAYWAPIWAPRPTGGVGGAMRGPRRCPHSWQNVRCGGFSRPHVEHFMREPEARGRRPRTRAAARLRWDNTAARSSTESATCAVRTPASPRQRPGSAVPPAGRLVGSRCSRTRSRPSICTTPASRGAPLVSTKCERYASR